MEFIGMLFRLWIVFVLATVAFAVSAWAVGYVLPVLAFLVLKLAGQ